MTIEPTEGGRYFIHVDQDTLSVYVGWALSNDAVGMDGEEPYIFYRYPRENRLTQVTYPDGTQTLYQYNKKNNMVSTTTITETATETTAMTYDIENRLLQSGATLYEYDNNGNMITGNTAYRYYSTYLDGYKVNWLVGVGTVGGGGGGDEENSAGEDPVTLNSATSPTTRDTRATTYGYALDGRRVGKAGYVNMKYLYDGENVVYELWDQMTVRFTHPVKSGGGCGSGGCGAGSCDIFFTDHPISITIWDENGVGTKYYYLYDGLGSVTELIDANENVVNFYRYTPFGDALIREEQVYNPHQFTGRQYDAESELYHYRARAYSADIGRFMQQDPAGMVDGANMYAYVGNNPVNGMDPSGTCIAWALILAQAVKNKGLDPQISKWRYHFWVGCELRRKFCTYWGIKAVAIGNELWQAIDGKPGTTPTYQDMTATVWGGYYGHEGGLNWWGTHKKSCVTITNAHLGSSGAEIENFTINTWPPYYYYW
jgi:RHS repeat-associated protein